MPSFCPFVANFVRIVVEKGKIGICAGNISVIEIGTGSVSVASVAEQREEEEEEELLVGDRFRVALPYAGQYVTWEVIFNGCYPKDAPEIILGPDDEEFRPDIDDLENYCNWDASDEESLLLTLRELLSQYRAYQLSLLSASRLEFDYNSLLDESSSGCRSDDIEVFVSRKNGFSSGPVRFLIRLNVDFTVIPDYLMKDVVLGGCKDDDDMALLLVTYQSLDGGTVAPQILFSPRIERVLAVYGGVRILPFPHEGCLMDYVPAVRQHLEKTIQSIVTGFERRKEYTASFGALFGSQVVEFDSIGYSQIVCLFEWQNFRFFFSVDLSSKFPQDQPTFTFQSVYHTKSDGSPYCKTFNRYPYSPRWTSLEMAERARTFIINTIPSFQKDSIQEGHN